MDGKPTYDELERRMKNLEEEPLGCRAMEEALNERVKELRCVYAMAGIIETNDSTEKILREITDILPAAWYHSEGACSQIIYEGLKFSSGNYRDTRWKMSADIVVHGKPTGSIHVGYLQEFPERDEGPFLKEERALINNIAERLGRVIERQSVEEELRRHKLNLEQIVGERTAELESELKERRRIEKELRKSERRFQMLFERNPAPVLLTELESGKVLAANSASSFLFGFSVHEAVGKRAVDLRIWLSESDRREALGLVLKRGYLRDYETPIRTQAGDIVYVLLSAEIISFNRKKCLLTVYTDITEQRRMGKELRESEERYHAIFEQAADGIFIHDRSGKIVAVNERFAEMHGYSVQEILERGLEGIDAAGTAFVPERMRRILNGEKLMFEVDHFHKDGSTFPLAVSANLVSIGERQYVLAIHRDIAERKKMEIQISKNQERFQLAAESAQLGTWELDIRGNLLSWDDRMHELYGVPKESFAGTISVWEEKLHPEDRARAVQEYQAALRGERDFDIEFRILRADGRILWIKASALIQRDEAGRAISMVGLNQDITARKMAEQMKNLRADLLEFAMTHSLDLLLQKTLDIVEDLSQSFISFYHFVDADQKNLTLQAWSTRTLEHACRAEGKGLHYCISQAGVWVDCVREGGPVIHNDYRSLKHRKGFPEGHAEVVRELVVPIKRSGIAVAILGVGNKLTDYDQQDVETVTFFAEMAWEIAERKRAEKEREELRERLHRSEKIELLGQLAGGVAHDINNILGVTVLSAELLNEKMGKENKEKKYVENILSSSQKASAIVQDLLTLARRGVAEFEVVNLNHIIVSIMKSPEMSKLRNDHPEIDFQYQPDMSLPNTMGSSAHVEKAIYNLILNAAESISGQGEIVIRTDRVFLEGSLPMYEQVKEGEYAMVSVEDTGEGIKARELKNVFEPFYTTKKGSRSGTGLGLTIVSGTMNDHQGYVDVRRKEKGTIFELLFPATRESWKDDAPRVPAEEYLGRGEPILVVDDVEAQRDIAVMLLDRLGYRASAVGSGEEAIDHVRAHNVDLILLDMIMTPGIDGAETLKRILEIKPWQRAIIVSGFSMSDRIKDLQAMGSGRFISKPYTMEKIGIAIREELARASSPWRHE